jgi:signal transduction histidine kinase
MGFMFELLIPFLYAVISGESYGELYESAHEIFSIILTMVDVILLTIYLFLIKKKLVPKNFKLVKYKNITMLIMNVLLILVFVIIGEIGSLLTNFGAITFDIPTVFLLFTFLLAAAVFIGILFITQKNIKEQLLSSDNKMLELQLSNQLAHYNQLEKSLIDTRKIKHDMKNHIIALRYLLEKNQYQDASNYLDDLDTKINTIASSIETGNNIFDAIYIEKREVAKSKAIEMEFSGAICKTNFIDPIDLCTIVSNSIDNAIEACSRLNEMTDKRIIIESKVRKNYWVYTIRNTSIRADIINNTIKTSKTDVVNHGFGLGNIRESAEKYNGTMDIKNENDEFVLQIILETRT